MSELASLVRQFPVGAFFILLAFFGAVVSIVRAIVNRHRPIVHCDHDHDHDDCDDDEEEDED